MKKLNFNRKQGNVKLQIETQDDLWYLTYLVDPGDFVKGKTLRKIQKGTEEKSKQVKKVVFLKIEVEKIEFSKNASNLRIGGKVIEGPEDVSKGSWHGFNIEIGTEFTLEKKKWLSYQLDKLEEACKAKIPNIIICVFDREESHFALMKKYGYELLSTISGDVQKKSVDEKVKAHFYGDIIKQLSEYATRYKAEKVILASPAFWKEDLLKELKDENLKKKIVLATCSSVGKNAIDEVLKRPETAEALREERASKEIKLVEEVLSEISKEGNVAYGIKETEDAAVAGAVKKIIITDKLIQTMREKGQYGRIDIIMNAVDASKGEITIISSEHEGGKKLQGLGGVAAILRYKLNY